MRGVFLWAARNTWLQGAPAAVLVHEARGPPVHARRDAGVGARRGRAARGRRHRVDVHAARREPDEPRRGGRGRRALHRCVRRDQGARIPGEVSVKPTQLGLDLDEERTLAHLSRLADKAAGSGSYLWIDMEGSDYVEATVWLYERLRADQPRTGICLQAYLKRTAADVERLRPLDPAIRLVKGAYDEPAAIAYRDKRQVDASYLALAVDVLKAGRGRPIRLGLGTHDVALIEQIAEQVAPAGVPKDGFEVEMLYGIRAREQYRLAKAGYRVQTLIAYGDAWYPWYMRRLAERPANVRRSRSARCCHSRDRRSSDDRLVRPSGRVPDADHRHRECIRRQRSRARARGGGPSDDPPPDRRARFRYAGPRPRRREACARRRRDALRAVPGDPRAARGDRGGRDPRKGFAADPSQVFVTVGGKGVMLYAILGLVDPGDEVIVPDPGYPIYESLTRFVGATAVPIPIRMENEFRLDVEELASLITPRTRLLIINSPANPTGGVLTRADLERIAELAAEHDLWVMADEIYGRILYDGAEHVSIASLPGMAERTIVLDGFSKTFAMTGWRLGYAVVPDVAHRRIRRARDQHDLVCTDLRPGRRGRRRSSGHRTTSTRWSSSSRPGATSSSKGSTRSRASSARRRSGPSMPSLTSRGQG